MKTKRIIAGILLISMLSASILSCAQNNEINSETEDEQKETNALISEESVAESESETEAETEPKDSLEARMDVSDELPEKKFGRTFSVIGDEKHTKFYDAPELTGEALNDAVHYRNMTVSDRFDIKLKTTFNTEWDLPKLVDAAVMAGDDSYQLVNGHVIYLGQSVLDGNMYDWNELPNIDFSKPWWSDSTVEDMSYKGRTLLAMGEYDVSAIAYTYCQFFNKTLAGVNNLPNMYELVNEGKWTIDKLEELTSTVHVDSNGNGKKDEEDTWGYACSANNDILNFQWAFGKKIVQPDAQGQLTLDGFYDEKYVDIVERVHNFLFQSEGVYTKDGWNVGRDLFQGGKTLIAAGCVRDAEVYRDVDVEYGIIPVPKWDEAQEEYHTSVGGSHEVMAVLKSLKDPEFVGTIAEALNAETWKQVSPAYYDITLKFKGARDEESIAMLDLIVDSRVFDFGFIYGGWGCAFWLNDCKKGVDKIASTYQANITSIRAEMQKVFEHFENYSAE